LVQGALF
jgi:hypothetical protein